MRVLLALVALGAGLAGLAGLTACGRAGNEMPAPPSDEAAAAPAQDIAVAAAPAPPPAAEGAPPPAQEPPAPPPAVAGGVERTNTFSITFGLPSPPAPHPFSFRPEFSMIGDRQIWTAAAVAAAKVVPWPRRMPPRILRVQWVSAAGANGRDRSDALGESRGDLVRLRRTEDNPLRDAFRAGHECAHFLIAARYGNNLPLWADEGLAQLIGYRAAEAYARPLHQTVHRTPPPDWAAAALSLDELVAATDYPPAAKPATVAAFYWQSAALVRALHARLGPVAFDAFLHALPAAAATDWTAPLRSDAYFNDADIDWLATQILPNPPPSPHYNAAWVL